MVFGTLISSFNGNTSRYSQAARQYQPDWQRAYLKAGATANSSANSAVRRTTAVNALLASANSGSIKNSLTGESISVIGLGTTNAILGNLGSKLRTAAQTGEQIALQTATRRLRDPVEALLLEKNPLYKKQELPPIPDFRAKTRNFLSKLREFQGSSGKDLQNPFPKASARVNQEQAFGNEDFINATTNYALSRNYHLRASIDRQENFILKDVLDGGLDGGEDPTHVAVKLHSGETTQGYDVQRDPYGRLEIYDSATNTVVRELDGNATEILTYAEFQQLRYLVDDGYVKENIDYINFVTIKDNGDGVIDASDERGSFEDIAVATNNVAQNDITNGQWSWQSDYLNEASARFSKATVNLEGTFVGSDALTDYLNGDLTFDVREFGAKDNIATLDEAASSGNQLVFTFDHAYDGIHFTAKYSDNEVAISSLSKVTTVFE